MKFFVLGNDTMTEPGLESAQKIDKSNGIAGVKKITLRFQALAFAKGTTKHSALTMEQLRHRVNTGK